MVYICLRRNWSLWTKEFDFEKFPSIKELTEQIERTMGRFEEFLSSNAEINETFLKF